MGQGQDQHDAVWAEAYPQHHIPTDQRKQPELKSTLQLKPLIFGALRASTIEQNKRGSHTSSPSVLAGMTGDSDEDNSSKRILRTNDASEAQEKTEQRNIILWTPGCKEEVVTNQANRYCPGK